MMRAWQVPAGVVTAVLIALCFDEDSQGVYYTLLSLVGLQALADSGLLNVIMHAVSHEWSELRLDRHGFLKGSRRARGRVAGIVRFGLVWFFLCAITLVVAGVGIGVALFFGQGVSHRVLHPLAIAMLFAGSSLALAPLIATLEGCNQVAEVNRFRLMQAITGSVVVWSCLVGGGGLWTPAAAVLTQLAWECRLLFGRYRPLVMQLWQTPSVSFNWKVEIWPLQWRIGLQSAARHLAFFPMIPTLFAFQGPAVAGRAGMTWGILSSLLLVGYAWIRTRAPEFGQLIAAGKRKESNQSLLKAILGSSLLLIAAVGSFWVVLILLSYSTHARAIQISDSLLSPQTTLWFALALLPLHLTQCFAIHLRSRKMDPIWRITIVGNVVLAAAIYWAARHSGAQAVGVSMLITFSIVMPIIFAVWVKYDRYYAGLEAKAA